MLFHSLSYLILLAVTVFLYWIFPLQAVRKLFLLIASLAFYASWSVKFLILVVGLCFVHWLLSQTKWYFLAIFSGLIAIGYVKYGNFLLDITSVLFSTMEFQKLDIILPLGISFYTFQLIAYTVDVNKKKLNPEKHFLSFLLFILFFPQLIAGPICRGDQLLPQLNERRVFQWKNMTDGVFFLLFGFILKTCFADGWGPFVDRVFENPMEYSSGDNWLATIGFGLQIFCDFWGYSTMAIGSGLLFGIQLPFNFQMPYSATSLQDFWRRWHITLSSWLRDYVYIPLGGARNIEQWKLYRNLILTFLIGGIWHGANWTFVAWGGIHGLGIAFERFIKQKSIRIYPFVGFFYTLGVVFISWVFFRSQSVSGALVQISKMLELHNIFQFQADSSYVFLILLFVPMHWFIHRWTFVQRPHHRKWWLQIICFAGMIAFAWKFHISTSKFIYFQF